MESKREKATLAIRLVPPGISQSLPAHVREGIYDGRCMDKVYACGEHACERIDRIALLGAGSACWADGVQEFIFDLLTNFPKTRWLSVEEDCLQGYEGATLLMILRQFHEAYPERSVCLTAHTIGPAEGEALLCDLAGGAA